MKKAPLWLALFLVAPALTAAQEKYTNADLDKLTPRRDAYTNADLDRLPPLPGKAAAAVPSQPVHRDAGAEALREKVARQAERRLNRDLVVAEIDYWEDLIADAHHGLGSAPNGYPQVGPDTGEAHERIKTLRRRLHMIDAEIRLRR